MNNKPAQDNPKSQSNSLDSQEITQETNNDIDSEATLTPAQQNRPALTKTITGQRHALTLIERRALRDGWPLSRKKKKAILYRQAQIAASTHVSCDDSIKAFEAILSAERQDDARFFKGMAIKLEAEKVHAAAAPTTVIVQNLNQPTQDLLKTIDPAIFRAAAEREQLESQQGLMPGVPRGTTEPKTASENQARADKPAAIEEDAKPGYRPGRKKPGNKG